MGGKQIFSFDFDYFGSQFCTVSESLVLHKVKRGQRTGPVMDHPIVPYMSALNHPRPFNLVGRLNSTEKSRGTSLTEKNPENGHSPVILKLDK